MCSANVQYPVRVEALYKDIDFHTQMTRDELVAMAKDIFDRLPAVINAALANAKLKAADIDSFVLIGGASRIPHVQETIRFVDNLVNRFSATFMSIKINVYPH